jgi:hypothetical protein
MGHLQSCAVPVEATANRDITPVDIERTARAGVQPVPSEIRVVDLDCFVAVELQPAADRDIDRTVVTQEQPLPSQG